MDELLNARLSTIAAAVRERKVKSTELVKAFLDRIEKVNPALNAVVCSTADLAMKYAAKFDAELESGSLRGPLHGVPMTMKDSLDTAEAVTTWGTQGRKDYRPGGDATCVSRLRHSGAILMGKTNTPEFTLSFQTDNLVYGRTNNPFDPSRTPGGSSGGAAAIIAAGASPFDIGTDTGGSIRLPSHFCGITGIKPTTGRVPCTGNALPSSGLIASLSQPGPLARYVDDLALLLPIISGPDFIDPYAVEAPWHDPDDVVVNDLRIGYHTDNGIKTPTPEIRAAVDTAAGLLRDEGIQVNEARPSGIEMAGFISSRVFSADGGEMLEALLEDSHTTTPSPRIQNSLDRRGPAITQREVAQIVAIWDNYRSSMLSFFRDFDVLVCPVNAHTAITHGTQEDISAYSYTMAYNLTGWPGAVIRGGTDGSGLPIGIQIVSRPFREDHCLAVARWLEARLGQFPGPAISAAG
ncbi:MAG TPA: amidase [Pseudomonadales bacterium]|nr:amidase [Pseudomonadales bacterium]